MTTNSPATPPRVTWAAVGLYLARTAYDRALAPYSGRPDACDALELTGAATIAAAVGVGISPVAGVILGGLTLMIVGLRGHEPAAKE